MEWSTGKRGLHAGRRLVLICALLIVSAAPAAAQFDRGTISGTIKDEQGGVMPGVAVTARQHPDSSRPSRPPATAAGFTPSRTCCPAGTTSWPSSRASRKSRRNNVQLDATGQSDARFRAADRDHQRGSDRSRRARRRCRPTSRSARRSKPRTSSSSLSPGRNPIGVVGLKAGVMGGNFNSRGFSDLGNGGFNINGSRAEENNITIDGATAIRTRSAGAIVGIQNVDAIQEVQVLTANYMPEYGRASGGQIRFVTKSGSSRYSGSGSYFLPRRQAAGQHVVAQPQPECDREQRARRRSTTSSTGYSFGGPVPGHAAQGSPVLLRARRNGSTTRAVLTNTRHGADRARCGAATSASC